MVMTLPVCDFCGEPSTWTSPVGVNTCTECRLANPTINYDQEPIPLADLRVQIEVDKLRIRDAAYRQFRAETHPPFELPPVKTLRDRLADPRPDTIWRVENWQPQGTRVMLAAQFKAGKTTLTGNLARCLVDGDWWLDSVPVTPVNGGKVTIIDFEMSERQIDGWLSDQGIRNDDKVNVIPLRGHSASFDIIDDQLRADWAERLTGTEYLILDCLRPILDALGLDEHKDGGRFLTAFDALCAESAIDDSLIVHHMGHTNERARGDSRFRDWPDVEWRLVREDDNPGSPRYISAYGRDVDVLETQLRHDPATRHLKLVGGNRANAAARAALEDILRYLTTLDEPATTKMIETQLLTETEHKRDAIRAGLTIGVHDGQIHQEIGPHNSRLHTLSTPVRRSSPSELANSPVSSPKPFRVGELETNLNTPPETIQFAEPKQDRFAEPTTEEIAP